MNPVSGAFSAEKHEASGGDRKRGRGESPSLAPDWLGLFTDSRLDDTKGKIQELENKIGVMERGVQELTWVCSEGRREIERLKDLEVKGEERLAALEGQVHGLTGRNNLLRQEVKLLQDQRGALNGRLESVFKGIFGRISGLEQNCSIRRGGPPIDLQEVFSPMGQDPGEKQLHIGTRK